jgi:UDPglucose 6-dehydrogenase
MKIAVAGAGFVGVVHSAVISNQDNQVILFDLNEKRIQDLVDLCEGKTETFHIHEPGLPELLKRAYKKGNLKFTTDGLGAIKESTIIFSCVGTPSQSEGKADLQYVESVAHMVGKVLQEQQTYKLLVNKSTVPVGTARRTKDIIKQYYQGDFEVASNPETLAEGRAVRDASMPKRIIIGANGGQAKRLLHNLYAPFFLTQQEKVYFMSPESAELTKYACNAYLASQVVLTNIFANVAKRSGANWRDMVPAILDDIRIGKFVHPGLGFGGSCFDKDMSQLYHTIKDYNGNEQDSKVLSNILEQNRHQRIEVLRMLDSIFGSSLLGKKFAVWGLSFKKETNDIRDASSLEVVPFLLSQGAVVNAHDPEANEEFAKEMARKGVDTKNLTMHRDKYEATCGANALLILNDWKYYKLPDFHLLADNMSSLHIFDGKDLLNYTQVKEETPFNYYCIGRPDIKRL